MLARLDDNPVGCGALRCIDAMTVEIKRMYVVPAARRRGFTFLVLTELERLAEKLGYERIILETGIFQAEVIGLYHVAEDARIEAYGRHIGNPEALCFGKGRVQSSSQRIRSR